MMEVSNSLNYLKSIIYKISAPKQTGTQQTVCEEDHLRLFYIIE